MLGRHRHRSASEVDGRLSNVQIPVARERALLFFPTDDVLFLPTVDGTLSNDPPHNGARDTHTLLTLFLYVAMAALLLLVDICLDGHRSADVVDGRPSKSFFRKQMSSFYFQISRLC